MSDIIWKNVPQKGRKFGTVMQFGLLDRYERLTNFKFKMAAAAILKYQKIAIYRQRLKRFVQNLA